ncbi:hypothetical protein B0J11DRAFT_578041 [Dendryphion nanum]|uniref:F-box domain-containing protein n=1 Tax=Dendryphion nanum TaxID=256645 RepID=A0A9P9E1H2_9PLEO|nr:hypothetical protein B0J11DRAFT_578041 [Dendryphion nanum]
MLPTEMVEAVADNLSLIEFRQLRLVCSSLQQQSLHQFRERFFRQKTLAWEVESFESLLQVTKHPYFGKSIRHLIIESTPTYAIRLWKLNRRVIETPDHDVEHRLTLEEDALADEACRVAKFWNETRYDQKSLMTFFEQVRTLESITLSFNGMERHLGKFARMYCERSRNEMSRPFVTTMFTMATLGATVDNIFLHEDRNYGAISIGRLESLSPVLSKFEDAFTNLHTIQLNLRDWRFPEEGFEPPIGRAPFVVRFLSKCTNIRRFEVSCFSSLEGNIFPEMAKHCKFPFLERCHLDLFRVFAMEDLLNFLDGAKDTLRVLSLSHVVLRDETADWSDIMRSIASGLNLESLELKNLFNRRGGRVGIEGTVKGAITLSGPDLKSTLEYHADNLVVGNWGPAWHLASTSYPFIGLRT